MFLSTKKRNTWMTRSGSGAWPKVLALSLFLFAACAPSKVVQSTPTAPTETLTSIKARLVALSAHPVIQRAAAHRLSLDSREPDALAIAVSSPSVAPQTVRDVLATEVDDVVIVDWLVSFGAMGTWTAFNPRSTETISIPVTDIAFGYEHTPNQLRVYRLRDAKHLMLVLPVVVHSSVVGAVGFVFTQVHVDSTLEGEAVQLV